MFKFLISYLVVTGIMAAVALAVPGLVAIGFVLLILPGLVLSLAPTAFLWGCFFTFAWLAARMLVGDNVATVLLAGAATAAMVTSATQANRVAGRAALKASLLPDSTPARPIEVKGDVRVDRKHPQMDSKNAPGERPRYFECDTLCLSLLFTPDVTSVTINDSKELSRDDQHSGRGALASAAATYRLVPKVECPDGGLQPNNSAGGLGMNERRARAAEWDLKLATEVCLTRSPPVSRHDLLLRDSSYGGPVYSNSLWSFAPRQPRVEFVEIRSGDGTLLLRRLKSQVSVLSRFLWIAISGGLENMRFGWGRTDLRAGAPHAEVDLNWVLKEQTNVLAEAPRADLLPAMRDQLRAALADPSLSAESAAFRLIPVYFAALPDVLADEDLDLVTAIVRDARIETYDGIWEIKGLPLAQQNRIRAALTEKALRVPDAVRFGSSGAATFLKNMPDGAFATLTPTEERLLTIPERRPAVAEIIARLNEAGAERAPFLLSLIRDHASAYERIVAEQDGRRLRSEDKRREREGHDRIVEAARIALCRLGPDAHSALQPLEELIGTGVVSARRREGHGGSDWNLTLARLGKPLSELSKPERMSGTDENHRKQIQYKLDRFDPRKSC